MANVSRVLWLLSPGGPSVEEVELKERKRFKGIHGSRWPARAQGGPKDWDLLRPNHIWDDMIE